jgi:opacity protein-like surface antigen
MEFFMNKAICTSALVALLASTNVNAMPQFFVKVEGGAQSLSNYSKTYKNFDIKDKYSSKVGAFGGVGAGVNITDSIRADLTFSYYGDPEYKYKEIALSTGEQTDSDKAKLGKTYGAMVNGAFDLVDFSVAKLFIGGGIGATHFVDAIDTKTGKKKGINRFSYALSAGVNSKISDNVALELSYSWRQLGDFVNIKVRGHHALGGVRFSF